MELVEFSIYDNDGRLYKTYMTEKDRRDVDGHPARTLRLLNQLKSLGQQPVGMWDSSLTNKSDSMETSEWLPRQIQGSTSDPPPAVPAPSTAPGRATGKTGAVWEKDSIRLFLTTLQSYGDHLRSPSVPDSFWRHISDVLYAQNKVKLNFSSQQLRCDISSGGAHLKEQSYSDSSELGTASRNLLTVLDPSVVVPSANNVLCTDMPSISGLELTLDNARSRRAGYYITETTLRTPGTEGRKQDRSLGPKDRKGWIHSPMPGYKSVDSRAHCDFTDSAAPVFNARRDASSSRKSCHSNHIDVNGNLCKWVPHSNVEVIVLDNDEPEPTGFVKLERTEMHDMENNSSLTEVATAVTSENSPPDSAGDSVQQQARQEDSSYEIVSPSSASESGRPFLACLRNTATGNVRATQFEVSENLNGEFLRQQDLGVNSAPQRIEDGGSGIQLDESAYLQFDRTNILASTPANQLHSPARKKRNSAPVFSPRKANRLSRTPKRKVGAYHMVWDRNVTDQFLDACLSSKNELKVDDVPVNVWKGICADLLDNGIEKEWQVIRAKYENMNKYFRRLIGSNGMVNNIKWVHYAKFCEIYGIDEHFDVLEADDDEEQPGTPERMPELMNIHEVPVSAKQCKGHMDALIDSFRKDYDRCNKTGGGAPKFQFYEEFLNIFEGCPTLQAPVSVSVGRVLTLSKDGVKEADHDQHSRTRPKADTQTKVGAKGKKATSSKHYSTLQSNRKTEDRVAEEVRRMTDIYEKESQKKYELFASILTSYKSGICS
ncbi:hypothetical protein ONE63_007334 [Megalurothrips usitatus]|uniref:Myb/SANT-like DNA-binding domain-containing protein n=1 Tax=Megalurothrips usitatus TaxID=439358 RepID=A0AAV7XY70_9NEOP|nr:hypothetical protein ONE63_007334 [Megalurothrips usitatus]